MSTLAIILWFNCSVLLGCVIAYGLWVPIRKQRLKYDLLELRVGLISEVGSLRMLDEPEFTARLAAIDRIIAKPDLVDWLTLIYVNVEKTQHDHFPTTEDPRLRKTLDRYWHAVWKRIALNLLGERVSGLVIVASVPLLQFVVLPWAQRRKAGSIASGSQPAFDPSVIEGLINALLLLIQQTIGRPATLH